MFRRQDACLKSPNDFAETKTEIAGSMFSGHGIDNPSRATMPRYA
jgi:hypothetical protein